jgi:hypothetical protein
LEAVFQELSDSVFDFFVSHNSALYSGFFQGKNNFSLFRYVFDKRLSISVLLPREKIVFVGNRRVRFVWLW